VGPIARLEAVFVVDKLPKTRSGKILRGTIKSIANEFEYKAPATIEDSAPLEIITEIIKEWLKGKKQV
jgi:propionyl-CoA synthetase